MSRQSEQICARRFKPPPPAAVRGGQAHTPFACAVRAARRTFLCFFLLGSDALQFDQQEDRRALHPIRRMQPPAALRAQRRRRAAAAQPNECEKKTKASAMGRIKSQERIKQKMLIGDQSSII